MESLKTKKLDAPGVLVDSVLPPASLAHGQPKQRFSWLLL